MIKKYTQQGSAHIIIVVTLVVALLATLGFVFWQNFIDKDSSSTADTSKTIDSTAGNYSETPAAATTNNQGYVVVKEWGVKFKSSISDKLEYKVYSSVGLSSNTAYDALGLKIKLSALIDKDCTKFGTDLYRQTQAQSDYRTRKMGDYYYFVTGAPGECSEHASDIKIQTKILSDLAIDNLEAL